MCGVSGGVSCLCPWGYLDDGYGDDDDDDQPQGEDGKSACGGR